MFDTLLYDPLLNTLIYIYTVIPWKDLGIAIILLTILIKILLFWPSLSALKSQRKLQDTQPKIEELKAKYKDNKEELGKKLMGFYKENKVNPFSSCLPLLIQLPILFALYRVFFAGLSLDPATRLLPDEQIGHLYGYLEAMYQNTPLQTTFLGIVDLTKNRNILLAVITGLSQFLQTKMLTTKKSPIKSKGSQDENIAATMNKQMLYIFPFLTAYFAYTFPSGLALYWATTTVLTILQQLYFLKWHSKNNATPKQATS